MKIHVPILELLHTDRQTFWRRDDRRNYCIFSFQRRPTMS